MFLHGAQHAVTSHSPCVFQQGVQIRAMRSHEPAELINETPTSDYRIACRHTLLQFWHPVCDSPYNMQLLHSSRLCTARLAARRHLQPFTPHTSSRCRGLVVKATSQQDTLLRSLSQLGEVAVLVVRGTNLVAEVRGYLLPKSLPPTTHQHSWWLRLAQQPTRHAASGQGQRVAAGNATYALTGSSKRWGWQADCMHGLQQLYSLRQRACP